MSCIGWAIMFAAWTHMIAMMKDDGKSNTKEDQMANLFVAIAWVLIGVAAFLSCLFTAIKDGSMPGV